MEYDGEPNGMKFLDAEGNLYTWPISDDPHLARISDSIEQPYSSAHSSVVRGTGAVQAAPA